MTNIYFLLNTENNNIKIGQSKDLRKRLKELQVGNSAKLKMIYYISDMEESFEFFMHRMCERYHILGEWFRYEVLEFLLAMEFYQINMKKLN